MTPEHVLQERKDNQANRNRVMTPEEDKADLKMMEQLYQERLAQATPSRNFTSLSGAGLASPELF